MKKMYLIIGIVSLICLESFKSSSKNELNKICNVNVLNNEAYLAGHSSRGDCLRGRGNCMIAISVNPDPEISTERHH